MLCVSLGEQRAYQWISREHESNVTNAVEKYDSRILQMSIVYLLSIVWSANVIS